MTKINFIIIVLVATCFQSFGQQIGLTFQDAAEKGISIDQLDNVYASALHSDTSLAVFKTEKEQEAMQEAYLSLLRDLGAFLTANDFFWDRQTRCFNRVYFSPDGTIDYFLFNFLGETQDRPSEEKEKEFQRLLNLFIKDYKFSLTADTKFAQCSPVAYSPKK